MHENKRLMIKELLKRHETPFYLYFEDEIINNYKRINNAFGEKLNRFKLAYSIKNCFIPGIIRIVEEFKPLYEVTSFYEMLLLDRMGINLRRCIYTNIYKSNKSLEFSINKNVGYYAIDSYSDFLHVEKIAKKFNKQVNVLLRINPALNIRDTVFASAVPWSKTGVELCNGNIDCAESLVQKIIESDYLILKGFHGHLGSQVTNIEYYREFIKSISQFFKYIQAKYDVDVDIIDLGGGYPVPYRNDEHVPSIEDISKVIGDTFRNYNINPYTIIETGRFITATAGVLISKVVGIKYNPNVGKIIIIDISTYNHLLDSILVDWYFEVETLDKKLIDDEVHIVGCTNDSLDHVDPAVNYICPFCNKEIPRTRIRKLPKNLKEDDIIIIKDAGAYTTCFNNNYCLLPLPQVFLLTKDGKIRMLRKQEEFNHIMSLYTTLGGNQNE